MSAAVMGTDCSMPARCAADSRKRRRDLREQPDPLIRKDSPLSEPVKKPKATWVEPVIIEAEVAYSTVTENALLGEAVFKGVGETSNRQPRPLRDAGHRAQGAAEVRAACRGRTAFSSCRTPSKKELAAYWTKVRKRALAHLGRRPLKLVRHVRGTTFYHKGRLPPVPEAVHQLTIEKREGGEGTRLWVDDSPGYLAWSRSAPSSCTPGTRASMTSSFPDMLVFDLDPGECAVWDFVIETALAAPNASG